MNGWSQYAELHTWELKAQNWRKQALGAYRIKEKASAILERVDGGEDVVTSTIHVSEALNIVEARLGLIEANKFLEDILATENIEIEAIGREDYEEALTLASRFNVSPNDAVAALISIRINVTEAYSFDRHFDNFPFIRRVI